MVNVRRRRRACVCDCVDACATAWFRTWWIESKWMKPTGDCDDDFWNFSEWMYANRWRLTPVTDKLNSTCSSQTTIAYMYTDTTKQLSTFCPRQTSIKNRETEKQQLETITSHHKLNQKHPMPLNMSVNSRSSVFRCFSNFVYLLPSILMMVVRPQMSHHSTNKFIRTHTRALDRYFIECAWRVPATETNCRSRVNNTFVYFVQQTAKIVAHPPVNSFTNHTTPHTAHIRMANDCRVVKRYETKTTHLHYTQATHERISGTMENRQFHLFFVFYRNEGKPSRQFRKSEFFSFHRQTSNVLFVNYAFHPLAWMVLYMFVYMNR